MQRKILIYILLWFSVTHSGFASSQQTDSSSIVLQSDSSDIMRTRAIGRYDRGITNYRFIPKKKWIGGATFSYVNYESTDASMLFSLLKDFTSNAKTFKFRPFVGYAIRDNVIIGMEFGYNHTVVNLDNININIADDLNFSLSGVRFAEDLYTVAFFHRSYVGLDPGRRFGLFNETSLMYKSGSGSFTRTHENTPRRTDTDIDELNLGISPGVSVFIMQNVCAEMSFGVAGFKYRSEKQRTSDGEEGSRRASGANFKINILNINLGITVCI